MRKGFDGLSGLIMHHLKRDPTDGSVYVFVNRRRDRVKMLVWDRTGLLLFYKRLEKGTFELPEQAGSDHGVTINWEVLVMMMEGISMRQIRRRKRYNKAAKKLG